MDKIKAVIDTNVFIRSLIGKTKSNPKEIINALKKSRFSLILSDPILTELGDALKEPEFKTVIGKDEIFRLINLLRIKSVFVAPAHKINICRDPHDNKILETALTAKADFIVSGDKDLTSLKTFPIPVMSPKRSLPA